MKLGTEWCLAPDEGSQRMNAMTRCLGLTPPRLALLALGAILALAPRQYAQTATAPATAPATQNRFAPVVAPPAPQCFEYGQAGWYFPPAVPRNLTPVRTVQLLGEALQRQTGSMRHRYLNEIGLCKRPEGLPFVLPFLTDQDPALVAQALRAAAAIADPSLHAQITPRLADANPLIRREAFAAALAIATDAQRLSLLNQALADPDPRLIVWALRQAPAASTDLIVARLDAYPPTVQSEALAALARLKASRHADALVKYLTAPLPQQCAAIQTLAALKATQHLPAIRALLKHEHPSVRRYALAALADLASPQIQQQHGLEMLTQDPDPTVRQAAATLFIAHPLIDAVDALAKQLDDPYLPLHDAARQALVVPNTPQMTALCIDLGGKLLHHQSPRRQEDGSFILGKLKSDRELKRHVAILAAAEDLDAVVDWPLMTQVAWSLGWIGDKSATGPVMPLLKRAPDNDKFPNAIAETTGEALFITAVRLGVTDAVSQANRVLNGQPNEQDPAMRAAATYCLGQLGGPNVTARLASVAATTGDSEPGRVEAIKNLVQRRATSALPVLQKLAGQEGIASVRGAAHWAVIELTNTPVPFTPADAPWVAQTSIIDVSKQQ